MACAIPCNTCQKNGWQKGQRKVWVSVTTEDGAVLDRVEIEMEENETKIAITPLHDTRMDPASAAAVLKAVN